MWTGEFGLAMLDARRLCLELIPTFSHGKEFQANAIEHAIPLNMHEHYDKAGVPRCIGDPDTKICPTSLRELVG